MNGFQQGKDDYLVVYLISLSPPTDTSDPHRILDLPPENLSPRPVRVRAPKSDQLARGGSD